MDSSDDSCVSGSVHDWEYCVADEGKGIGGGTPYYFCRLCKKTWYRGAVYGFKGGD